MYQTGRIALNCSKIFIWPKKLYGVCGVFLQKLIFFLILLLSVSCGEDKTVTYEIYGAGGKEVLSIPKEYARIYKGEVTRSFVIPYKDMPKIGKYFIPGEGTNILAIRALLIDRKLSKEKRRKLKIKLIGEVLEYDEIPSELSNYRKYAPKNYKNLGGVTFFYVSPKFIIKCAASCRYDGVFNENIVFDYGFPKSEIRFIEKIDASVKILIKQFINDYKH
jgi:hypothetical protein